MQGFLAFLDALEMTGFLGINDVPFSKDLAMTMFGCPFGYFLVATPL